MSVLIRAIECFVMAVMIALAPAGIGFALGWIMRGEKNDMRKMRERDKDNEGDNKSDTTR